MGERSASKAGIVLMNAPRIQRALDRMACEILEDVTSTDNLAVLGIDIRGYNLAVCLCDALKKHSGRPVTCVRLAVRGGGDIKDETDQLSGSHENLILVDDVLFSGTVMLRAMRHVMDLAAPADLQIAVLVDRGHRRFPISARYTAINSPTKLDEHVAVMFNPQGKPESVILTKS
jgi:pyrimidine operon attenuation protein / uracil phosphoribosyltransferase